MARTPQDPPPSEAPATPATWLRDHGDRLFAYALSRTGGDAAAAEDLVQETLLAGIKAYDKFEGKSRVETWLTAILRRKIIDRYRSAQRRKERRDGDDDGPLGAAVFNEHGSLVDVIDWGPAAGGGLESAEFSAVFDQCLAQLPPQQAEAFTLVVMDGLSTTEACSLLGVTPTNLSVRLHRARVALRKLLQDAWFGASD